MYWGIISIIYSKLHVLAFDIIRALYKNEIYMYIGNDVRASCDVLITNSSNFHTAIEALSPSPAINDDILQCIVSAVLKLSWHQSMALGPLIPHRQDLKQRP
jgi:hypothetical protein